MNKVLKGLAIAVLLLTVIGAGAVLYGINTLKLEVEQVSVTQMPAVEQQGVFDEIVRQLEENTFAGVLLTENTSNLRAEDCTFLTYTVRFQNKGFFPAEWISLEVQPSDGAEILTLADNSAHVLPAGSRGDLSVTLLCRNGEKTERKLKTTFYVFGHQIVFDVTAGN